MMAIAEVRVFRAGEQDRETAFRLVEEYNDAVDVLVRDSPESFARDYFGPGAGFWLAQAREEVVGCIALRPLTTREHAGEIKRLYVRPEFRRAGAAAALLEALERYAAEHGYRWLYLDSKNDLQTAVRFYEKHGYAPCERYNENQQATIFMRKAVTAIEP
jgi:ribosomal protein S18 acetylase RimI-like enzyme